VYSAAADKRTALPNAKGGAKKLTVLRNVQALRAIAALLVVCVHMGNPHGFEVRYLGAHPPLLRGIVNIGETGVDLFFVISGFIMAMTTLGRRKLPSSVDFFKRRIMRIYPLYWLITGLLLVVYLRDPALVNAHSAFRPDIVASFLALPQRGMPLLLVGWSLVYEMYFYLVFAAALSLGKRSFLPVLAIWALATLAFNLTFGASNNPWLQTISNPICFEFLLGVGVGWLTLADKYRWPGLWLALGIAGYAADCAIGFSGGWVRVAQAIPLALIVFGAVGLERRAKLVLPKFLDRLGDASYATYLCHVPVLAVFGLMISRTPLRHASPLEDAIVIALGFTLIEVVGLGVYRYVERPLANASRHLVSPQKRLRSVPGRA
jgi:peptidoglycan/LPS O-acetylase OafA/YrhL